MKRPHFFKRSAYALLLIVALLFLWSRIELWRGKQQWEAAKTKLAADGLQTDWSSAIPTPVPEAQNLALARVLTGCYQAIGPWNKHGDWQANPVFDEAVNTAAKQAQQLYAPDQSPRTETPFGFQLSETELFDVFDGSDTERIDQLASILSPYHDTLAELRDACDQRAQSYFPGDYTIAATVPIPSFKIVRPIVQLLTAEAILALHQGDTTLALQNCQALIRIANLNPQTPLLVNTMIKAVVLRKYLSEVLWYGISQDVFNESQLHDIIELCQQHAPVTDLGQSYQFEILCNIATIQEFNQNPIELSRIFGSNGYPLLLGREQSFNPIIHRILWYLSPAEGWNLLMAKRYVDWAYKYNATFNLNQGTVDLKQMAQLNEALDLIKAKDSFFDSLLLISVPAYQRVTEVAIDTQRRLDLIEIAATLILATKQGQALPDSISSDFEALPTDPTNDHSYLYQKNNHGFGIRSSSQGTDESINTDLAIHWSPTQQ